MKIFSKPLSISNVNSLIVSFIVSFIGLILGIISYYLTFVKSYIKKIFLIIFSLFLILFLFSTYFIFGPKAYVELIELIIKIILFIILCSISGFGIFGILCNRKNIILVIGGALIAFFFISDFLSSNIDLTSHNIEILILLFVIIISYIEIAPITVFLYESFNKMSFSEEGYGRNLALRFNKLINYYLLYISIIFVICYFFTYLLYSFNYNFDLDILGRLFGFDQGSNWGVWLFTILLIVVFIVFWFISSFEKKEEA